MGKARERRVGPGVGESACRRGRPLATTDRALRLAATRHGLAVLPA
jgi:hypothetical protein